MGRCSAMRYATRESWRMSLSASCVKSGRILPVAGRRPVPGCRECVADCGCGRGAAGAAPHGTIERVIAHLDLDAFFAAVELHRHPELRGKPLVVGGEPAGRGVVSTASYEARRYGIRSAMSSAEALRRCPHAVFVRPDQRTYREWSERTWEVVRAMAPVVEQTGIDEGYLVLPDG